MATENVLMADVREARGTTGSRRLRRGGNLPGVVNSSEGNSRPVTLNQHAFEVLLRKHTSENLLLDLKVGDANTVKVLLREVQHDPVTGVPLHAEFQEVSMTRKMRVRIAVSLVGDPVGVTQEGGMLEQLLRDVEVDCLPGDLVEVIEVDVSDLHLNKTLFVRDIKVSDKLQIHTDGAIALASVVMPKEEEAAATTDEAAGAAEAAAAQPEVVGEKEREAKKKQEEGSKG